jgi:hypothetical protein
VVVQAIERSLDASRHAAVQRVQAKPQAQRQHAIGDNERHARGLRQSLPNPFCFYSTPWPVEAHDCPLFKCTQSSRVSGFRRFLRSYKTGRRMHAPDRSGNLENAPIQPAHGDKIMTLKPTLKTITFAVATAVCLAAGTVSAERPANIARTTWTLQANRDTVELVVNTQGGPGAPGAANCRTIRGELGSVDVQIQGWYCPSTGRIHFVHKNLDSGNAVRVFTGNVSDIVPGEALHMAGTMTVLISPFGDLGEYNFSATTVEP